MEQLPDSATERPSLLDLMMQKMGDAKTTIHQIVIMSQLGSHIEDTSEGKADFAAGFNDFFSALHDRNRFINVTGLLLIYPKFCIHFIECPTEILQTLCKKVHQHEAAGDLATSKVLFSSDVHTAAYARYDYQVLNLSGSIAADFKTNDPTEVVVADCLKCMLGLGHYTRNLGNENGEVSLGDLQEAVPDLVPPQGVLEYCLKQKEIESLASYSNRLNQHLHVVLDGDTQWPIPERLYPYE